MKADWSGGSLLDLLASNSFSEFDHLEALRLNVEYAEVGDDAMDDAGAGEREGALAQEL